MLGEIHTLADNLWLIEGEMPDDNDKHPDLANALVYRRWDTYPPILEEEIK